MQILALVWFSAIFALAFWAMRVTLAGRGERVLGALMGREFGRESSVNFDGSKPDSGGGVIAFSPRQSGSQSFTRPSPEPLPLAA